MFHMKSRIYHMIILEKVKKKTLSFKNDLIECLCVYIKRNNNLLSKATIDTLSVLPGPTLSQLT